MKTDSLISLLSKEGEQNGTVTNQNLYNLQETIAAPLLTERYTHGSCCQRLGHILSSLARRCQPTNTKSAVIRSGLRSQRQWRPPQASMDLVLLMRRRNPPLCIYPRKCHCRERRSGRQLHRIKNVILLIKCRFLTIIM